MDSPSSPPASSANTGKTVVYSSTLPVFQAVIPASIRRRIPRLYRLLHRSLGNDNEGDENNNYGDLRAKRLRCISEPQLAYHGESIISGFADDETITTTVAAAQRPPTAGSSSSDEQVQDGSLSSVETSISNAGSEGGGEGGAEGVGFTGTTKYEDESGLRWNRVIPALNLLRSAGYEAQQSQPDRHLIRSIYINSLAYLLDALPTDLSTKEATLIQEKLPQKVKTGIQPPQLTTGVEGIRQLGLENQSTTTRFTNPPEHSYLHRLLASGIVQFFLLLQFVLPYAKTLFRQVYQYERTHRITERTVAAIVDAADSLGKGSVSLGSAVLGFNEGKVGVAVLDLAAWWVEGIAGGIYEGVGEGMMVLGVIRDGSKLRSPELNGSTTAAMQVSKQ